MCLSPIQWHFALCDDLSQKNQTVSPFFLESGFSRPVQQLPLGFRSSQSYYYRHAIISTETKFSLLPGDAARSTNAADTTFRVVKGWDIFEKMQRLYGIRRWENSFPHMVMGNKSRLA